MSDRSTTSIQAGKRYPCKVCEKTFSTSGQLSRHNRIHKGVKRCDRSFFRADNREQHAKSHMRRIQRQQLRESEAIACRVLSSGALMPPQQLMPATTSTLSPPLTPPFVTSDNKSSLLTNNALPWNENNNNEQKHLEIGIQECSKTSISFLCD
ncbi:hypothetical protein BCR33DRAFT_712401 [Rhizoclosmatium globosum]|uniref:C2H2-type domain-containing protein n=1 Tax=Rhizoclosmatium globosum TaxID=329046 RepID=A0A1Y2CW93_9FUNG|nr:hypothetical protein BCR33DRAFT_712401 [Rhizoclosmatium globosum]|eukprot:ORY51309.1 hypothetical protein BCR33DRAFT_712401 [Rhizoclosmatium globosum]